MSKIPGREVTLRDVCQLHYGKALPAGDRSNDGFPVFGSNGVVGFHSKPCVSGPTIIIGRKGSFGEVAYSPTDCWPIDTAYYVEHDQTVVDLKFLYFRLKTLGLTGMNSAAAVPGLKRDDAYRVRFNLPALRDQQVASSILWAYNELIENNARRIEILEEMAQAIYREWFVEFRYPGHKGIPLVESELGPIPKGWSVAGLSSVCTRIQAGGTPSRKSPEFWDDGVINWFRTTELQDGFLFDSSEKISQAGLDGSSAKMFDAGSILMAIYGSPTVGRLGVLTLESSCNQAALALVPDESVVSHPFLFQALTALRGHFNSIAQGAAQQNISKATVASTQILLPPRRLVDLWDQVAVPIWDLTRTLTQQLGNLRETRDLLLPRLISGEIDVSGLDIKLVGSSA